jgi:hypothetical protein
MPVQDFLGLFNEAHEAGMKASADIYERETTGDQRAVNLARMLISDDSIVWISIKSGYTPFAIWLKEQGFAVDNRVYGGFRWGGVVVVVNAAFSACHHSLICKQAYANAFAAVLRGHGYRASTNSFKPSFSLNMNDRSMPVRRWSQGDTIFTLIIATLALSVFWRKDVLDVVNPWIYYPVVAYSWPALLVKLMTWHRHALALRTTP